MKRRLVVAVAACGGGPRYLGAQLPDACAGTTPRRCLGWMAERDLAAAELDLYDDAALRELRPGRRRPARARLAARAARRGS